MQTPEQLVEAFRATGLKVTPQRRLLFELLHGNTGHPTADALYAQASEQMPGISLRTVYQTLTDLAEMGELGQVVVGTGATRFDPNTADHHHAVCGTCGSILDVYVDRVDEISVDGFDGFTPDGASIVFHGTCASCAGT